MAPGLMLIGMAILSLTLALESGDGRDRERRAEAGAVPYVARGMASAHAEAVNAIRLGHSVDAFRADSRFAGVRTLAFCADARMVVTFLGGSPGPRLTAVSAAVQSLATPPTRSGAANAPGIPAALAPLALPASCVPPASAIWMATPLS